MDSTNFKNTYTTPKLLDRAYTLLKKENKNKKAFVKPQMANINRKSYITNFIMFCSSINREPDHVMKFLIKDMNTDISLIREGNIGSDEYTGLKFNNLFRSNQIMNSITNYMKTYVLCELCKSGETNIVKIDRINYIQCDSCKAHKALNNE
jgi:translation initiation factor 2 subunit 2